MKIKKHKPKILVIDIEWKPTKAYVWQPWQENITPEKIIEHGGLLCVGAKWVGKRETYLFTEWGDGHENMLKATHSLLSEADAVVTYNGDKYDLRKLNGEFILHGMHLPPPPTSIDLIKTAKKLGYFMNRLGFIGPFLGLGKKLEHEGMALWTKVEKGDEAAQRKMGRYCIQDVVLTEKLYKRLLPAIQDHPHLGFQSAGDCGACGSPKVQKRGFRRTRHYQIQRLHCTDCGGWFSGTRKKVT